MTAEKLCLKWNDFEANISRGILELKDDKDFCDVTLACEDHQLQAHKVVLKLRSIPSALEIHIRNLCIKY